MELRIRLDTVEVFHRERQMAVFDRDALHEWWLAPRSPFEVDDVKWAADYEIDVRGRDAISMPLVDGWTLSPENEQAVFRKLDDAPSGPLNV